VGWRPRCAIADSHAAVESGGSAHPVDDTAHGGLRGGDRRDCGLTDVDDAFDATDDGFEAIDHREQSRCELVDLVDRFVEPLQGGVEVACRVVQVDEGLAQPLQDGVDLLHRHVGVQCRLRELADPLGARPRRGFATFVNHARHYDHIGGTVGA
jgi:hypothetical protein